MRDHIVIAAERHIEDEEAAHERACYGAATANGLTADEADECDGLDKQCPLCPWRNKQEDA